MARNLVLVLGLITLIALAGAADAPAAAPLPSRAGSALVETVTMVGEATAGAGTFGVERVLCPSGMVALGGGVDMDNVLTMNVTSSAPVFDADQARLISQPTGTNPAPVGWQATALNNAGSTQSFKVGVICAPLSNASTVVGADTAGAGSFGVERVLCPVGTVAVGGGVDMDNVLTMAVSSSAPTFDAGQARLISQPAGINPAPVGWQASALNNAGSTQGFKVGVICAPLPNASTVVGADTAGAGSFGVERVLCPAGTIAVGGGVDMDNVLTMAVSSSAPTFDADQARLISQPAGTNPAPIGWQASALNNAGSTQGFKVGVICAAPDALIFLPFTTR